MQTRFTRYGSPKVKREMWQRHTGHQHRYEFGVSERVGSGAALPKKSLVTKLQAVLFMHERAVEYLNEGYAVTWHDKFNWFIAIHETKPTVFCALQGSE